MNCLFSQKKGAEGHCQDNIWLIDLSISVIYLNSCNVLLDFGPLCPPPPSPKSRVKVIPCIKEDFSGASQRFCKVSVNLWCHTILGSSVPLQVSSTPGSYVMWHFARRGLYHYLMPDYAWRWLAPIWWYQSISGQLLTYSLKYSLVLFVNLSTFQKQV